METAKRMFRRNRAIGPLLNCARANEAISSSVSPSGSTKRITSSPKRELSFPPRHVAVSNAPANSRPSPVKLRRPSPPFGRSHECRAVHPATEKMSGSSRAFRADRRNRNGSSRIIKIHGAFHEAKTEKSRHRNPGFAADRWRSQ